jgi:hypothetical protein
MARSEGFEPATLRHPEANWHQEAEERANALRTEHERVAAHYTAMARQREEREERESLL